MDFLILFDILVHKLFQLYLEITYFLILLILKFWCNGSFSDLFDSACIYHRLFEVQEGVFHFEEIILVRMKTFLYKSCLMFLEVIVKLVRHYHLIINLIVNLYVRGRVIFWNWRSNSTMLTLALEIIHVHLVFLIKFLFLWYRGHFCFWGTSLPVVGPRLIDNTDIVVQTLLMTSWLSIVILNISVTRHSFIIDHRHWRLLSIFIGSIFFTPWHCGAGILNVLTHLGRHKRVANWDSYVIKIFLAISGMLGVLVSTPIHWLSASCHVLCRNHIVKIAFLTFTIEIVRINCIEPFTTPSWQLGALSHLILLSLRNLSH